MASVNASAIEVASHDPIRSSESEEPLTNHGETVPSLEDDSEYRPRSPSWRLPTPRWDRPLTSLSPEQYAALTDPHRPQNAEPNEGVLPFPTYEEPAERRKPRWAATVCFFPA